MAPRNVALHLVGDATSPRAETARAASKAVQFAGSVRHSPNLATAVGAPTEEIEILVLLEARREDVKAALATSDVRGVPRWAVLPHLPQLDEETASSAGEWETPILANTMQVALQLLALRRENARLRGDLCTVGRRLAHDLRTPLNSISTANEALAEVALVNGSDPKLHGSIAAAVEEACGLLERVGAVFMASARAVPSEPVDMAEVVWNARQRLDAQVRGADATISAPEQWPEVNGAPDLLELVWVHLLANSVQHGGATPRIELGWDRAAGRIRFWIRDRGAGIPAPKRRLLFHPLDRLNELNAPRGYGLSLVQRLVELHGGSVGYEPEPLGGGTFYFLLP